MSKQETEFKPEYLYTQNEILTGVIDHYYKSIIQLNELTKEAENVLKRELTPAEKEKAEKENVSFVMVELTKKFQFPNASVTFNLDSQGINLTELNRLEDEFKKVRGLYKYQLVKEFEVSKDQLKEIELKYSVFTKNDKQNSILDYCNRLEKIINEMENENIINEFDRPRIANALPCMSVEVDKKINDYRICVNKRAISLI